jgi:hypothetical protein
VLAHLTSGYSAPRCSRDEDFDKFELDMSLAAEGTSGSVLLGCIDLLTKKEKKERWIIWMGFV